MPQRQDHTETEIRLAVESPGRFDDLPAFQPPRATEPKRRHIVTTYFDTPGRDLARRGLTLRIRRSDEERIQAVKSSARNGAANRRTEWEWPIDRDEPDLGLVASAPVVGDFPPDLAQRLQPTVVTDIVRTTRDVRLGGNVIEVAQDSGSIVAGEVNQPMQEVELELREGAPGALYRLALTLHAEAPVVVELESKPARGLRLRDGEGPHAAKSADVTLDHDVSLVEGFRRMVENGSVHLLANRAAALAADPEGVHQARIAIRRLRSALQFFAPCLEPHAKELFNDDLRRLGRRLGEARNWDVFCLEALPQTFAQDGSGGEDEGAALVRQAAAARRAAAAGACAAELSSASFSALTLGLSAWAETGSERPALFGDRRLRQRLEDHAPELLDRLARKVAKRARSLAPDASPAELHPLRKSLKKLRYVVEFVSSLYPRKEIKRFLKRLKGLQKALGAINDSAMAIRLAEELAHGRLELALPVSVLAVGCERVRRSGMRQLDKQWVAFRRQDPFWL